MTVDNFILILQVLQLVLVLFIFYNLFTFKQYNVNYYLLLITSLILIQMIIPPIFRRYVSAADDMNIK